MISCVLVRSCHCIDSTQGVYPVVVCTCPVFTDQDFGCALEEEEEKGRFGMGQALAVVFLVV